ncbi:MAG: pyridoxamine 5'-phosphate oxidase family protein [Spirochaetales bacterium]
MDSKSILDTLERVIDEVKIAVLATNDGNGQPHMRWMTPSIIRGREGSIFAVTSPEFAKAEQVQENPRVEWMVQSKPLDEIVKARGTLSVIDNPAVKAMVLESIGGHLSTFWKMNPDSGNLIVLETLLDEITYEKPVSGERVDVSLGE